MSTMLRNNSVAAIALAGVLASLAMTSASASTYMTETLVCPVGGEKFERETLMSNTTFGSRPDGKPYSIAPAPFPIAECPGNRLLILDDFTDAEIAQLPAILESADYAHWVANETQYYRASMLAKKLGRSLAEQADMLTLAIWETDDDPAQRTRYLTEYLDLSENALANESGADAFWRNFYMMNAERELGGFDAATERLAGLSVSVKEKGIVDDDDNEAFIEYLGKFAKVIAEENRAIEPFALIPENRQIERCVIDDGPLVLSERKVCADPDKATEIARLREQIADWDDPGDLKLR